MGLQTNFIEIFLAAGFLFMIYEVATKHMPMPTRYTTKKEKECANHNRKINPYAHKINQRIYDQLFQNNTSFKKCREKKTDALFLLTLKLI